MCFFYAIAHCEFIFCMTTLLSLPTLYHTYILNNNTKCYELMHKLLKTNLTKLILKHAMLNWSIDKKK